MEVTSVFKLFILFGSISLADGCDIGAADPSAHTDSIGNTTDGRSFFSDAAPSGCCGSLGNWKFYAANAGTVTAMLWRPTTGSNFRLVYMEDFTASTGLNTPLPSSTVAVETGDVVGWKTDGNETITYSSTGSTQSQLLIPTLNSEVPWSQTPETNTYAFGAVVTPNEAPTITGGSETILATDTSQTIHTLAITDTDAGDLIADTTVEISATSPATSDFTIDNDGTNFIINSGASLTAGIYELTVTVTDVCMEAATATVTVTVENEPPVFDPITPDTEYGSTISDSVTTATQLYAFSVIDTDTVTCTLDNAKFEIRYSDPFHQIWLVDNPGLDYDTTPTETMTITCTDGFTSIQRTYSVDIVEDPMVITNLGVSAGSYGDHTAAGTQVHQFTVTDNDDLVTCTSDNADFSINALDLAPGEQKFDVEVAALNEDATDTYTLTISCTDGTVTDTGLLGVTVTDDVPTQTGLDFTAPPAADGVQAAETSLGTYTVEDENDGNNIACSIASPNDSLFQLATTTTTTAQADFEVKTIAGVSLSAASSPYLLAITCTDDEAANIVTGTVTVPVADSPPIFLNLPDTAQISESETARTSLFSVLCSDATECYCHLADTVPAAGIEPLELVSVALPVTEYAVYAWNTKGFDSEGAGSVTVDITCGDGTNTVTDTLTVDILNDAPVITNPGGSTTISADETGSFPVKQILIEEYDAADTTCTMADNDGCPFDVVNNVIEKTAGALDYNAQPGHVCNLDVTCTDGTTPVTDTFTVNIGNIGPEITNTELGYEIMEERVRELAVATLTLSEDATDCTQVAPTESEFVVKYEPSTSTWAIYYVSQAVAGKPLSFETKPIYSITTVCTDAEGAQGPEQTFTIKVLDNEEPLFTNIDGQVATVQDLNAKDFSATDTVFTVTARDRSRPKDDITFNMLSCEPADTCPFTITPGGDIVTSEDLYNHENQHYTVSIQATDKYNLNTAPQDLILRVNDINTIPTFTNLPKKDKVGVMENQFAAGDTVYQISVEDPDTTDTVEIFCSFTDGGDVYFECDPATGEVKAKTDINYEEMSQIEYRMDVYAYDGYEESTVEELTIRINDENEEPEFTTNSWSISVPNEGGAGVEAGCPDFDGDIVDEDTNDDHKYTMDCPSGDGVFVINKHTGCVTMLKEWDLDDASKRLGVDTVTCTVTATDKGGLTTTTSLDIEINEEDDNQPYLDQTSYIYCAYSGSTSGTLGQVTSDDNDVLPDHRTHTYDFTGGGSLFAADGNGVLTHGDVSNYAVGTSFETTLRVTDEAGNFDDSPVTVMICEPPPPAPPAAAAPSASASSSSSSMSLLWLIPLILLSLLLLGLAAYLLRKFCCAGKCGPCAKKAATRVIKPVRVVKRVARPMQAVRVVKTTPVKTVQAVRVVKTQPVVSQVHVARPQVLQAPVQTAPPPPPPPRPPSPAQLPTIQDLPMHNFWARDKGNIGASFPTN